ncbi:unnamed protein product [Trichogramma brassicae]|uniref:RNase H type-1 domain-containing protein n=1 Tax=Trichogramma brassicae TaxID=86971 RepID=A0A6H5HRQ1_9HYME|nr:unnamed protein product [Trichogramma brassicae]
MDKTDSVERGHVSANWLLQFEQKFFEHIDQRFNEFTGRLSLLEATQAQHTADLSQLAGAMKELRTTCCAEFISIRKELRSEVEALQIRNSTLSDTTSLTTAVPERIEDPCEVRFGGFPTEVDATATVTATKILKAMGLARFGAHIVRVREWVDRDTRASVRPATRQMVVQFASPLIRDQVISSSPRLRELSSRGLFGVGGGGCIYASSVLPRDVYHLWRRTTETARRLHCPRPFMRGLGIFVRIQSKEKQGDGSHDGTPLGDESSSESLAIILALEKISCWKESSTEPNADAIRIFSDSRSNLEALNEIHGLQNEPPLVEKIKLKLIELADKDVKVEIFWIPAHIGLQGNENADANAKKAAAKDISSNMDIPVSDIFAKFKYLCKEKDVTHAKEIGETKGTLYFKTYWNNKNKHRKVITTINRIRCGHNGTNAHLSRFKIKARATHGMSTAVSDGLRSQQGQTSVEKPGGPSLMELGPLPTPRTSPYTMVKAITGKIIVAPLHCKEKDAKLPSSAEFATGTLEDKLERLDGLIRGLGQFIQGKSNLHKEVISYQVSLGIALSALRKSSESQVPPRPPVADKAVCTSPLFTGSATSKRLATSPPASHATPKRHAVTPASKQHDENNNEEVGDQDGFVLVDRRHHRQRKQTAATPGAVHARQQPKPRPVQAVELVTDQT